MHHMPIRRVGQVCAILSLQLEPPADCQGASSMGRPRCPRCRATTWCSRPVITPFTEDRLLRSRATERTVHLLPKYALLDRQFACPVWEVPFRAPPLCLRPHEQGPVAYAGCGDKWQRCREQAEGYGVQVVGRFGPALTSCPWLDPLLAQFPHAGSHRSWMAWRCARVAFKVHFLPVAARDSFSSGWSPSVKAKGKSGGTFTCTVKPSMG